jgi:hypothetical protein
MKDQRFVPIVEIESKLKIIEEAYAFINSFKSEHCRICGDTEPKHGFYPLWGMAVGKGIYQSSGLTCNRCNLSDEKYEEYFGEPKENI